MRTPGACSRQAPAPVERTASAPCSRSFSEVCFVAALLGGEALVPGLAGPVRVAQFRGRTAAADVLRRVLSHHRRGADASSTGILGPAILGLYGPRAFRRQAGRTAPSAIGLMRARPRAITQCSTSDLPDAAIEIRCTPQCRARQGEGLSRRGLDRASAPASTRVRTNDVTLRAGQNDPIVRLRHELLRYI